jgi:hypothetical protein
MRHCYDELLSRNPNAQGRIQTRFVISPDGTVSDVCLSDFTLNDDATVRCVLSEFSRINFEPAAGYVAVVYPLAFEPGPAPAN